jgi:DNA mismatch endonuclease Vsr
MDRLTKEQRSKVMQAIKAKDSKIETMLAKALWAKGYRYRKNYSKVIGKPDIVFSSLKIAVFCDSEFWHGKDWEKKKYEIKSNQSFWHAKIEKNIERDKAVTANLNKNGWIVLRFWGKDIEKSLSKCLRKIEVVIKKKRNEIFSNQRQTEI